MDHRSGDSNCSFGYDIGQGRSFSNGDTMQRSTIHGLCWTLILLAGCVDAGSHKDAVSPIGPEPPPSPGADSGAVVEPDAASAPEECAPDIEAVSILPRSSNHEVWQLYSDLLSTPLDAELFARWTPLAQVRGFDHMTESRIDAQTLAEQLHTTEAVAEQLVNTPAVLAACPAPMEQSPICPLHAVYDAQMQFSDQQGADCWRYLDSDETQLVFDGGAQRWMSPNQQGVFIWRTGLHPGVAIDVIRRWTAPVDGEVILQGALSDGDSGGGDGIIGEIRAAGEQVFQTTIVNGGAPASFDLSLDVQRGDHIDILVRRNETNSWDSTGLTATLIFERTSSTVGLDWASCGRGVVEQIASRAWRRPLRGNELTDLQVVFDQVVASADAEGIAGSFFEGLKATLQAALLSPHVQYKPEFVPGGTQPNEEAYRRASRLALFFRGSFPDDALWALAESGRLNDDALAAEASRLLAEDGARFVENFGGQWLSFRGSIAQDETPLARSMRREAHDVLAAVLDERHPATRLLEPGFTVVDGRLAEHYGLDSINSDAGPTRVMTTERGGLFEQGHFLTSGSSGSDFKRVIHRGIYTLNRTLCSTIPPLDPATLEEIAATAATIDPDRPLAERMQMHRESTDRCMGCHSQMDPLGLALERFDAEGKWRDTYPDGSPIEHDFDFNGVSVRTPEELKAYVSESDTYRLCVAEKLFAYGLHRAPRNDERCLVDQMASVADPERSLHDLAIDAFLISLAQTETP
jgi:hypothetical protein